MMRGENILADTNSNVGWSEHLKSQNVREGGGMPPDPPGGPQVATGAFGPRCCPPHTLVSSLLPLPCKLYNYIPTLELIHSLDLMHEHVL